MACTGRNLEFGRATVALAAEGKKEPRDVCATFRICPHRRGFRRRRFLRRRTSSPRPPQHTRQQRNLPADHPRSCGGALSRGLVTRSPFPGEVRNRDFAAKGRRALPQHLAAQSNTSARLRGYPYGYPLGSTARRRRRGQRRPKWPSQILWGGTAAPGGLRLTPSTLGHGNGKTHTHNNQPVFGWQHVGADETCGGPWKWPLTTPSGI